MSERVAVVGAGLVGSLLSIYLAQRGHQVSMYERRPDMRQAGVEGGRSINLALSDRGWKALAGVGIDDNIREIAIPMKGRKIHDPDGELAFQPYGREDQAIYSVSRGELNLRLLNLAEERGVNLHFEHRLDELDLATGTLHFACYTGESVQPDRIYGTDGAFSACRLSLMKTDRFNYSQSYLEHGYKELTIPPTSDGGWRMEKNALHIWPRKSFMLIALPNLNGSYTCTLFFPFEGDPSFSQIETKDDVEAFFTREFPDAWELMPTLLDDYFENPTSSLCTVRCYPWHYKNKVLLLGDASHAIVPFYGQGMNAGFEDCRLFDEYLETADPTSTDFFADFSRMRKPDGDAIADLALQNFIEMRDKVADPTFLLRKKIDQRIGELNPEYTPVYTLVTFSHTPYREALAQGRRQDVLLDAILAHDGIEETWDTDEGKAIIVEEMARWRG